MWQNRFFEKRCGAMVLLQQTSFSLLNTKEESAQLLITIGIVKTFCFSNTIEYNCFFMFLLHTI